MAQATPAGLYQDWWIGVLKHLHQTEVLWLWNAIVICPVNVVTGLFQK